MSGGKLKTSFVVPPDLRAVQAVKAMFGLALLDLIAGHGEQPECTRCEDRGRKRRERERVCDIDICGPFHSSLRAGRDHRKGVNSHVYSCFQHVILVEDMSASQA